MEKWRSKGKGITKEESILPPTRRPSSQNCLPIDKKKDRKWSFGGFLRRISHGQHNEPSSNDEDITYIPGHMLSEKNTKKVSKMKSRLGKMPCRTSLSIEQSGIAMVNEHHNGNKDTSELTGGSRDNIDRSQDSICACNDSIHSQSSEGSSDLLGRINRINRVKARAQAKRDRLRGNSSSDDDSHRSSQSSMRLRSEDNIQNVHRADSCNRRTRGARTERYIKRMFRDDGTSNSDTKLLKPNDALSRFGNLTASQCSSNSVDCNIWRTNDAMKISAPSCSSPCVVRSHGSINGEKSLPGPIENCYEPGKISKRYLRDMNENVTLEREKLTWPKSNSRRYPANEIYGSLRPRQGTIDSEQLKVLPPDPPPRSSKSRVFTNVYNVHFPFNNVNPGASQSCRRYYQQPIETNNTRSYNSDNEVVLSEYVAPTRLRHFWKNCDQPKESREIQATPCCSPLCYRTDNHNSENRVKTATYSSSANRKNRDYQEDQENRDPRPYFENSIRPSNNYIRSTCSLPKGVQLFSRQRLANSGDNETTLEVSESSQSMNSKPLANRTMPDSQSFHDQQSPSRSSIILNEDEAKRKRGSKNLEDALCELEAIYNSLRLSDEDLLERAEQRSMEEYRINAAKKSTGEHSFKSCSDTSSNEKDDNFHDGIKFSSSQRETDLRMKDDMAYRRMNPKERPSSVNGQASLAQISYLATSPNLSLRDSDYFEHTPRSRRGTPDLTRDDLLFRSISHANNSLKVIEPQPPFGIPLGPVSGTTESDYLHAKPTKYGQTRSLYIPKTEPDVVCDDLAFRNLRKDMTKDTSLALNKNTNLFIQMDSLNEPSLSPKNTFTFGTRKKRAVRSHSADLYGVTSQNTNKHQYDWYDDYVRSTKKASFATNDVDRSSGMGKCNLNRSSFKNNDANSLNMEQRRSETTRFTNNADVDINGNRPKSALHGKIQVYVPQESGSFADGKRLSEIDTSYKADSTKSMGITESEDSSPERCDSRQSSTYEFPVVVDNQCIEQFTELEISEYQQLCQDLEKLIQRTADEETKRDEEARDENEVERNSENSQSELDDWEKLLNEDYELPASISAFDEIVEVTTMERDDDRSSSRSAGMSVDSENLLSLSTKNVDKSVEDELSSASELGICSNTGSFTDSVYDKFNQLLREVNDVPFVECTNQLSKYPTEELTMITNNLGGNETNRSISGNTPDENIPGDTLASLSTARVEEPIEAAIEPEDNVSHVLEYRTKIVSPITNLHSQDTMKNQPEAHYQNSTVRNRHGEAKNEARSTGGIETRPDSEIVDDQTSGLYREGEKIEDERACNEEEFAFKETSMHPFRKLCHVTNSLTIYDIVLCSFFLTLLITIIVAH